MHWSKNILKRDETINKISLALKGRKIPNKSKLSIEHRTKLSHVKKEMARKNQLTGLFTTDNGKGREKTYFQKGKLHPNWNGGITPYPYKLRKTLAWKRWRTSVYDRDNYTCQDCKESGGDLNPHHIIPLCKRPDLAFDINNGRTLCVNCHKKYLKEAKE